MSNKLGFPDLILQIAPLNFTRYSSRNIYLISPHTCNKNKYKYMPEGVTAGSPILRIDSVCVADASTSRRQRDGENGTNATGVYEPRNPGLEADPESA